MDYSVAVLNSASIIIVWVFQVMLMCLILFDHTRYIRDTFAVIENFVRDNTRMLLFYIFINICTRRG